MLAFETEIAKVSWPRADLRDIDKLNNPMTLAQLQAYAPGVRLGTLSRARSKVDVAAHDRRRQHGGEGDGGAVRRRRRSTR